MPTQIQFRHGDKDSWVDANPVLAIGEIGCESDNKKIKVGDGETPWQELNYLSPFPDFIAFFVK